MKKNSIEQAACNLIKRTRKYAKSLESKTITIPIEIDDNKISCRLKIKYNPSTKHVSMTHSLCCKNVDVHPSIHQKLKCTDQHTLDVLQKSRETIKRCKMEKIERRKGN